MLPNVSRFGQADDNSYKYFLQEILPFCCKEHNCGNKYNRFYSDLHEQHVKILQADQVHNQENDREQWLQQQEYW